MHDRDWEERTHISNKLGDNAEAEEHTGKVSAL